MMSNREDQPYGTLDANGISKINPPVFGSATGGSPGDYIVGKMHSHGGGGDFLFRRRLGVSFQLDASYPYGSVFTLAIKIYQLFNTLESGWVPKCYVSSTNDAAVYASDADPKFAYSWDDISGKTAIGSLTQTTNEQIITIPIANITPRLGSKISFVFTTDFEDSGSGSGGGTGTPQLHAGYLIDDNPNVAGNNPYIILRVN